MAFRDKFVDNVDSQATPTSGRFPFLRDEELHFSNEVPLHRPVAPPLLVFPALPYSPLEDLNPYWRRKQQPELPGKGPYAYRYQQSEANLEQHELEPMTSDPFRDAHERSAHPLDHRTDGIEAEDRGYFGSEEDRGYGRAEYGREDAERGPFEAGYVVDLAYDGSSDKAMTAQQRLEYNEHNRRKLQLRFPRFHWTKLPWFSMVVTAAQLVVFIVELARMGILTGSPFQTQPYFNPMLGPSTYLLINMGARYVPCMHILTGITSDTLILFPCANSTTTDTNVCSLNELCGISGVPVVDGEFVPDQWYRLILPIFLHAGFLHILFNLLLQVSMGFSVERHIGWIKYGTIYMASGIAGFLLGANFSPDGIASTGASGSLFGVIACNLLLFVFCGKKNTNLYATKHYKLFIAIMVAEVVVSFVLGLLPGLDNFSHIGGFCMGLLLSLLFLQDPAFVYVDGIYTYEKDTSTTQLFVNNWNPLNKWDDKIPWKVAAWAGVRVAALVLAILYFVLLTKNLYSKKQQTESTCSWCKYINCIPVHNWCEMGEVTVSDTTDSSSSDTATATDTASATSAEVLSTAQATYASSIENTNQRRDFLFGTFAQPQVAIGPSSHGGTASHGGTIAFVLVMALLTYLYVRRSRHSM